MPATHNIVIAEEYGDENNRKTSWKTIGVIIENTKDGKTRKSIKLNMLPIGNWDGYASIFPIDRDRAKKDNRRDATDDDQSSASDDMNQGNHTNDSLNQDEIIDDKPIDLSEIPF